MRKTSARDKIKKTKNENPFLGAFYLACRNLVSSCSKQPSHQAIEYSFFICFSPPLLSAFLRTAFRKARTI